jgi:hypothetical protein
VYDRALVGDRGGLRPSPDNAVGRELTGFEPSPPRLPVDEITSCLPLSLVERAVSFVLLFSTASAIVSASFVERPEIAGELPCCCC